MFGVHWEHPELLWLILPLVFYVGYLSRQTHTSHAWEQIADVKLIKPLLLNASRPKYLNFGLLAFTWLLAIIALAGPSWQLTQVPLYQNQQATVLVASLNDTMLANDLPPSRMVRMRYKLIDILKQHSDGQIGLITFAGEPYVVSPLTQDSQTISGLADSLSPDIMPVAGNNLNAALLLAKKTLLQAGQTQGHIIVLTADSADNAAINTAKTLASDGITTSVLGMATKFGAPLLSDNNNGKVEISRLDNKSLQALANAGQGQFQMFTADDSDINNLLNSFDLSNKNKKVTICKNNDKNCSDTLNFWHNQGYWLVWLCLPLVLLLFRRGSVWLNIR